MNRFYIKNIAFVAIIFFMFSAFLKAQTGTSKVNQDDRITELMDLKSEMDKDGRLSDRYKIQLFSGNANVASSTLKKYRNRIGTWSSTITYEEPNYKVWVGNFRNKLEAERALISIRKTFGSAFIFKPAR